MSLRSMQTVLTCFVVLAVVGGAVQADRHDTLDLVPKTEWTMTGDDNTVAVGFILNNTDENRIFQNVTFQVTEIPANWTVEENEFLHIPKLDRGEERIIPVTVYVPADTPEGNYSIEAVAQDTPQTGVNATATVIVEYENDSNDSDDDPTDGGNSDDSNAGEANETETGGGAPVFIEEDRSFWERIKDYIDAKIDSLLDGIVGRLLFWE